MNLISIVLLHGGVHNSPLEAGKVAYHGVGFQIDLSAQPDAVLPKLEDGSYVTSNANQHIFQLSIGSPSPNPRGIGGSAP